ncbi:AsmA family protein [Phaeovibrio sulfidiphilus]|uniref:AsmA family protein n=1 Tax=Phaeovibrio sulfidiphilus TaxID=1220600 RepID=A0A8J6YJ08_9PROT|nr:AsmA family protein [Phaeovibrio sulfidiphilus]MBE1237191.1 AsmA family protein [Phaeovibrio sulfidiphilus]
MRTWLVRLGIGTGALLALVLVLALVIPLFVDWNRYKSQIADAFHDSSGLDLVMGGDLSVSIVPSLSVTLRDISVSNPPGSDEPLLASADALSVRLSWLPLLRGAVDISRIDLVRPTILVEKRADGRMGWEATKNASAPAAGTEPPADTASAGAEKPQSASSVPDLGIASLRLKDGTVRYVDRTDGTSHTLSDVNVEASIWLVSAPSSVRGTFTWNGLPLSVDASVERLLGDNNGAFKARLGLGSEKDLVVLDGTMTGTRPKTPVSGSVTISARHAGQTLREVFQALKVPAPALPEATDGPFRASATVQADPGSLALNDLQLTLGETRFDGTANLRTGKTPALTLSLEAAHVDLDSLLAFPATAPAKGAPARPGTPDAASSAPGPEGPEAPAQKASPLALPTGFEATVSLAAAEALYRAQPIRNVQINARLTSAGTLDISTLSADLPGSTGVRAKGNVTNTKDGATLALGIGAASGDPRALLGWLGVDLSSIPADRLRTLSLQTVVSGTPADIRIRDTRLALDEITVTGAADFRPGPRPALGLRLAADTVNMDAWLPGMAKGTGATSTTSATGTPKDSASRTAGSAPAAPLLAGLGMLNGLDANVDVSVGTLKALESTFSGVALKGTLSDGVLTLAKPSGYSRGIGGTSLSLSGGLRGFGGEPVFEDTALTVTAPGADALFAIARRFDSSLQTPEGLPEGPVSVGATLKGTLARLGIGAQVSIGGVRLGASGVLDTGDKSQTATHDLDIRLEAQDLTRLARLAGSTYTPAGPTGALKATSKVRVHMTAKGAPARIELPDLNVTLGPNALGAALVVNLAAERPDITGSLAIDSLNLDALLPAGGKSGASSASSGGKHGANPGPGSKGGKGAEHWSSAPLGLEAALGALDADIGVKARSVTVADMTLNDLDTRVVLRNAALSIPSLRGGFHGGTIDGALSVLTRPGTSATLNASVANVVVSQFLESTAEGGGIMAARLDLKAAGESTRALVESLNGAGTLDLGKLDLTLRKGGKGGVLRSVLEVISALNGLGGGAGAGANPVTVSSVFSIANGVVSLEPPVSLTSPLYSGAMGGSIDLPRWAISTSGDFTLSPTFLGALARKLPVKIPESVTVGVSGSLDSPNISLGSLGLGGGSLEDGLKAGISDKVGERLERKVDKVLPGAGGLVNELLGGKERRQPDNAPATPGNGDTGDAGDGTGDTGASTAPRDGQGAEDRPSGRPALEDAARGLLRGLGR